MAKGKFEVGQAVYLISSVNWIKKATVLKYAGGLYPIKWIDSDGGTRIRKSRLFATKQEAEAEQKTLQERRR